MFKFDKEELKERRKKKFNQILFETSKDFQ